LSGVNPSLTKRLRMGMKVACSGTARRPTRARKRKSRPQNFIHENAYAAKAAIVTGMTVAGIVIMKLLKKLVPRLLVLRTPV